MSERRLRIVVADDHPVFCDGLALVLEGENRFEVAGRATDGGQAVRLAEELQPDVVVLDLNMPVMSGIEAAEAIAGRNPSVGIVMLTMRDDDEAVMASVRAGAKGYLLKGAPGEEIIRAVEAVGNGGAIFSAPIARRLGRFFGAAAGRTQTHPFFSKLTERERDILQRIAAGFSNTQIAQKLGLTVKTVRNHVSNILNKLQAEDRTQAAMMAREAGLCGAGEEAAAAR